MINSPLMGPFMLTSLVLFGFIWVLWDSTQAELSFLSSIKQEIPSIVKDLYANSSWLLSAIYASPRYVERQLLWDNLSMVTGLHSFPWVIVGDFNEMLSGDDKFGGNPVSISRAFKFQECLNNCGMIGLGFSRPKFIWSNHRPLSQLIQGRIDRAFANADWNVLYPETCVKHLERAYSDHCPIILSLRNYTRYQLPRPFRFQPMWLSHPTSLKWSEMLDRIIPPCPMLLFLLLLKLRSGIKISLATFFFS